MLLATLSVVPWFTIEPINSVKFLMITIAGFLSLGFTLQNSKNTFKGARVQRLIITLWLVFIVALILIFFTSEISWRQQLFGNLGRNTGLLFYLSIAFISLFALRLSTKSIEESVLKVFSFVGTLSIIYGFIQFLNWDPIPWNNPYGAIIGFQGNPNFQSSFIGLFAVYLVFLLVNADKFGKTEFFATVGIGSCVSLIILSQSIQGLFVLLIGAGMIILDRLRNSKFKQLYFPYLILMFTGFALAALGLLQKGPLNFLYQPSVSFRGDYWRAGIKMFQDHLIFGLGHSSFGDYYMAYRDATSQSGIDGRGPDTFSNSAHNIFIDIASSGGLVLLIPYVSIMLTSLWFLYKVYGFNSRADKKLVLFSALWIAYLLQTIISVQFITLALWGWVFLGFFVRNVIETSSSADTSTNTNLRASIKSKGSSEKTHSNFLPIVLIIVGVLVGILPLRATSVQKSAYESQKIEKVISAAYLEPQDADRMNQIALLLAKNNQILEAIKILNRASQISPRNHDTWNLLSKLTPEGSQERVRAENKSKILNPFLLK